MVLICRVKAIQIGNTKEKEEKNIVDGVWKKKYHNEKENLPPRWIAQVRGGTAQVASR